MASLRESVANPTEFMLDARSEPFEVFLSSEPPPKGGRQEIGPTGNINTYYPWGLEEAIKQAWQPPAYIIRYCLPVDDTEYLLAYCLDQMFDPVYKLMTGADFGEPVCELISEHLPVTFELLRNGNGMTDGPGLMRLTTRTRRQFAVAALFIDDSPSPELVIPPEVVQELTGYTMTVLGDLLGWPHNVPGLIQVLGGDDQLTRRLKGAQKLIDAIGNLKDVLG